jgi:hypothetical protein
MFLDIVRFLAMLINFYMAVLASYMGIKTMEKKDTPFILVGVFEILFGGLFAFSFLKNAITIIMEVLK